MINTTCCIWINPSGEAEGYVNTTEPATWLWKMTPLMGFSLIYMILIDLGLRDHGSKCVPNIRDYLAYNNHGNLLAVLCSLYE